MKRTLAAMVIALLLSLGVCVGSMVLIRHTAGEIEAMRMEAVDLMERGDDEGAAAKLVEMADMWAKHEPLLELVAEHEALHEVRNLLVEADANLAAGDHDDLNRSMKLLGLALEHLFGEEELRIGNVL